MVVSNNAANRAGALVTVLPFTSNVTPIFPFEVPAKLMQQVDAALRLHLSL